MNARTMQTERDARPDAATVEKVREEAIEEAARLLASKTTCRDHSPDEMRADVVLVCGRFLRLADEIQALKGTK